MFQTPAFSYNRNDAGDSGNIPVIDLTYLPDSDEEVCENGPEVSMNSSFWLSETPKTMKKVCHMKEIRRSRLKIYRDTLAEHVNVSLFSAASRAHMEELSAMAKSTYVGSSRNPYFGNALFAGESIKKGEYICAYEGLRLPYNVCSAMQKAGRPPNYALSVGKGVVIDALGYPYGAGMANHSCKPNAKLDQNYLRGAEAAPHAFLESIEDIKAGDEIEACYGYLQQYSEEDIDTAVRNGRYIPCRCLRKECRIAFVILHD